MKNMLMLLLFLFLVGCSEHAGTSSEVNTGKMIGTFVTKEGVPVHNATVELLLSSGEDDTGTVVKVTTTDTEGAYEFDSLQSGLYTVAGSYADSLFGSRQNITHIDTADTDLNEDTLFAPGFIKGVVKVEGDDLLGIQVFVPGTSIIALTDMEGNYLIDKVAPNSDYSLAFQKYGYSSIVLNDVEVTQGDTTVLDTVTLIRNKYPKGLVPTFDTLTGNVSLNWDRFSESTLGYIVYRKDTTKVGGEVSQLVPTNYPHVDTFFLDTLDGSFFEDSDTIVLQYYIRSVEADGSISAPSNKVDILSYYIPDSTDIKSIVVESPTTGDTLAGGDKLNIEWRNTGMIRSVVLLFSPNGGKKWYRQISGLDNKGYYLWNVPNVTSDSCLIEIFDYDQIEVLGQSKLFSIRHNKELNLLRNGEFDEGEKHWRLAPHENATGEFVIDADGVAQVTNLVKLDLGWKLPLVQDTVSLQMGATYKLGFDAKSSLATQELPVCFLNEKHNPSIYALTRFDITNQWDRYSMEFTMEYEDDLNSFIHISFAESLSVVQLDNFVLKRLD